MDDELGRYLEEVSTTRLLTPEEESSLAGLVRAGDREALDALVRANLRFVVSVARHYEGHGLTLSELIDEGNLGLIRAVARVDPEDDRRFALQAVWFIRHAILSALAERGKARVPPPGVDRAHRRVGAWRSILHHEIGRDFTLEELAEELGISEDLTRYSLAGSRGGSDDESLMRVEAALVKLPELEAVILRRYFGLDGDQPLTLEEIGSLMGRSRAEVRELKNRALLRLKMGRRHAATGRSPSPRPQLRLVNAETEVEVEAEDAAPDRRRALLIAGGLLLAVAAAVLVLALR